ncbi:rhombosortase [Psychrosphaera sp. B3R10]|uniref:Rhombosortase n=1 Tax=Psychrosphaera algicola TaxID=3023714 RepID=A0ABT5F8S5_9GAMM|nr:MULTISPECIES: rhombosortase [unclassified Psychrosphaera]MBU2882380.1 rhombosortase [Psychrosphaera sp. I2R16]MBU2989061.1 rhombosortase [Psychrosphaera sp. B3R10]MDC2887943.1 rhombosortase [Psychrosphaera sp. G1-22]
MLGLPLRRQFIIGPLLVFSCMILLHLFEPYSSELLGLFPTKVLDGEWWRVITGQLLHTNLNHLLLNSSGLVLVWALHGEYYSVKHYLIVMLLCLTLVGITLMFFANYSHYAGLSGVLHSLLIYGGIIDITKQEKTGWLLLLGIAIKVAYENIVGASAETEELIGASVATEAHLIGVIVGCVVAVFYFYYQVIRHK